MTTAEIGVAGLGVMGANLALNMAEKGRIVAVYNHTPKRTERLMATAGSLAERLRPCGAVAELAAAIAPPRAVLMMVPAGPPVDEQAEALAAALSAGDALIDGGNANFRDTRRRVEAYRERGLDFLGVGVSGGAEGARHGPSIMAGGSEAAWRRVEPIFNAIAAKFEGAACAALLGPDGAGHFVKTIHNGIEYADMQVIAELYGVLRDGFALSPPEMAEVFAGWNGGRLKSYLIEITATVLAATDADTGHPLLEVIRDTAGQKGTGRWAAIEAQDLGVPATVIEAAVSARAMSAALNQRRAGEAVFGRAHTPIGGALGNRSATLQALEQALLAGKIAAYAQGFAIMAAASQAWQWRLPLGTIARIWRAGCIIRSVFLDDIARTYGGDMPIANLMIAKPFADILTETHENLRKVVAAAALAGIAVPALGAALAYFDLMRTGRTTADLIQAQRDFFGAHGFERTDRAGSGFHGPWARA